MSARRAPVSWLAHFRWLLADHGMFYGPMSGWIPDLTMIAAVVGGVHWYREHTCHVDTPKFCWRRGKQTSAEGLGTARFDSHSRSTA